ncbi:MAG: phosphoribosylglycinamide formyltransferase [Clostridiales bacterium]|jgi:phosphoribosylglycinamide formyltransferase-1|nr:phosphoribosylglycinamide formyltransferase [Clostridiales bacterium]
MLKLAVLVSGGGTNLQAILDKCADGYLKNCEISLVVSSKIGVYALKRAEDNGIKNICIERKTYGSVEEFSAAILCELEKLNIELLVLAGFTTMLGHCLVERYQNKIINVHPSLIPSFCGKGFYGLKPHEAAIEYGVKLTGATVHFINMEYDSGPIILQKAVAVQDNDTPKTLQKRVMEEAEWLILPEAIKLISEGRVSVDGRRVKIKRSCYND